MIGQVQQDARALRTAVGTPRPDRSPSRFPRPGRPARCRAVRRWQADHVDLTEKLQIKPGQSLAILNPRRA